MIKYIVKGSFIKENKEIFNINAKTFESSNPIEARREARDFFNNWIGLMVEDLNPKFTKTEQLKIDELEWNHKVNHGIKVIALIDNEEFDIDFFGSFHPQDYDFIMFGLENEFEYFKKNNLETGLTNDVTYCDMAEFTEGYEETAIDTFKILETSVDFSGKDKPYWWLNNNDKLELIKDYIKNRNLAKINESGENHFREFKPSLLYNFKTERPSMTVKYKNAQAICAFLNTEGGKLYIGINDDGEAQGLEISDFKIAEYNKKDALDYVRLQFDSLMSYYFSKDTNHFISADFEEIDDKMVFIVNVRPSNKPVFLCNRQNEKNTKEFYIRTTASSIKVSDNEDLVNYCLAHWSDKES